jgi:hypothetical protein
VRISHQKKEAEQTGVSSDAQAAAGVIFHYARIPSWDSNAIAAAPARERHARGACALARGLHCPACDRLDRFAFKELPKVL